MKLRSVKLVAALAASLAALLLVDSLLPWARPEGRAQNALELIRPAIVQAVQYTFLEQEAGMAAYVNLGRAIDLSPIRARFRTLERVSTSYVVGSVPLPGYDSLDDVHAFVTNDGWVVAYYGSAEPASKIVDWVNYGATIPSKLDLAVAQLGLGVSPTSLRYFDFSHPTANRMLVVADSDSFYITVPTEFAVLEHSYSGQYRDYLDLEDACVGRLSSTLLSAGNRHAVTMGRGWTGKPIAIDGVDAGCRLEYSYATKGAIALVYVEP